MDKNPTSSFKIGGKEKEKRQKRKKMKKENEKKVRLEKAKILGQRWAMAKWITQFIKENQEKWDLEKMEKEKIERKYLEEWEKTRRFAVQGHLDLGDSPRSR